LKYFITCTILFLGLTSQAQSLTLGNCDSMPPDLYQQNLTSLTVSNGQGYCRSYDKTLDKRVAKLRNLKELSFHNDGYYSVKANQLPKQICKLKKLESLTTSSIIQRIFGLTQLKKLSLNLSADSAGYAAAKGFAMFQDS
jgi:hypothetical protein